MALLRSAGRRLCSYWWSAGINTAFQRAYASSSLLPSFLATREHVTTVGSQSLAPQSLGVTYSWMARQRRHYAATNAETLARVNEEISSQTPSKIFGVVHIGGRQFKVTPNDLIVVNKIPADIGSEIYLEKVLLAGSENFTLIGRPILSSDVVRVKATVTEHTKTAKVIVFKKKRRKNYKRTKGHRQDVTILRINDIHLTPSLR